MQCNRTGNLRFLCHLGHKADAAALLGNHFQDQIGFQI
jgi:hypothetical protein